MTKFLAHSLINPKKEAFFLGKIKKDSFIFLNIITLNCYYVSLISFNLFRGISEKCNYFPSTSVSILRAK